MVLPRPIQQPVYERTQGEVGQQHHRKHYRFQNQIDVVDVRAESEESDENAHDGQFETASCD